jgi:hypothetical protein
MTIKRIVLTIVIGIVAVGLAIIADAPYRKQVKEFTSKCHEHKGVVVQEHGTKNLLCFPADF